MFAFRIAVGMRLTRSSILVRRFWACRAYCARSFRARSVTGKDNISGVHEWEHSRRLTLQLEIVN